MVVVIVIVIMIAVALSRTPAAGQEAAPEKCFEEAGNVEGGRRGTEDDHRKCLLLACFQVASSLERAQESPKRGQERPKRAPREAKRGPKRGQESPRRAQKAPREPQESPREPLENPREPRRTQEAMLAHFGRILTLFWSPFTDICIFWVIFGDSLLEHFLVIFWQTFGLILGTILGPDRPKKGPR